MSERERESLPIDPIAPPPFESTRLAALRVEPVKPLRSPLERTLLLALLAAGVAALALALTSLRPGAASGNGWAVIHAPALLEGLAGFLALLLSMRWAAPGSGASPRRSALLTSSALGLALATALAAPHLVGSAQPAFQAGSATPAGLACLGFEGLLGLPVLVGALWLLRRGAAFAPGWAGALAGLGAGLCGDAAMHLHCPILEPWHTVPYHVGAVLALAAAGALAGRLILRPRSA